MRHISPPRQTHRYPDRDLDCQEAIEASLQDLIDNVAAAGWAPAEISEAIEQLATSDRMARDNKGKIDAANLIARIVSDRHGHA